AGLAVADDQLALAAADRNHRVDRDNPGLDRAIHRLACDHAGGDPLDRAEGTCADWPLVVDRLAQGVDYPAKQLLADRHRDDPASRVDLVALFDAEVIAQHDRADRIALEVQRNTIDRLGAPGLDRELQQLRGHRLVEPLDPRHAIAYRD